VGVTDDEIVFSTLESEEAENGVFVPTEDFLFVDLAEVIEIDDHGVAN